MTPRPRIRVVVARTKHFSTYNTSTPGILSEVTLGGAHGFQSAGFGFFVWNGSKRHLPGSSVCQRAPCNAMTST